MRRGGIRTILIGLVVLGAAAPAARADVVTYNSTAKLFVGDAQTVDSTITVPPGTTPVQSVQVTNFRVDWSTSAQELSVELIGPGGQFLTLFEEGCFGYEPIDVWAFSDSAEKFAPNDKNDPKCDLPGGTFKPIDTFPNLKKLAIFNGGPASGTWTLRATDSSIQFGNQGDIDSWALTIDHVPGPPAAVPAVTPPAAKKCKKGRKLKKGKCVKKKKKKK